MNHTSPEISGKKSELLAPAGSIEAFFAAMEAGADAVYCGLKEFSARVKAKNFTLEEVERLTAYAHGQNRQLYVAANTLMKGAELPRMVEVLSGLAACRIDGLIIQDLGLWRLAHKYFPEIPLHASTQMAIHNAAGVKMLERMGFTRAVLARELSIAEIAAIRQKTDIELEHFIHGALCYSISGQCFFSSHLAGKSGNRGRCVQPCRRRYYHGDKKGFYFSPSDLCAVDMMPKLADAGVMSFKIEGRMKNAEYVAQVVAAYRKVIDAPIKAKQQALSEAKDLLAQSYGRQWTTGFLAGPEPKDIIVPSRKGGIGQHLGQLEKTGSGAVFFTTCDVIHVGDRLRIQPESDLEGKAFTIRKLFIGKRAVKRANSGSFVSIPTPFADSFGQGDRIYKIAAGKIFTVSEEACRRRLASVKPHSWPVTLKMSCGDRSLFIEAECEGEKLARQYDVDMFAAIDSPLSRDTLLGVFQKTGHSSLHLAGFQATHLPPVVIPPSQLKKVRRDFYDCLTGLVSESVLEKSKKRVASVQARLLAKDGPPQVPDNRVVIRVQSARDLPVLDLEGVDGVLLPLAIENVEAFSKEQPDLDQYRSRITWDIPAIIYEGEWSLFQELISLLDKRGFSSFRLNNLGHFYLFNNQQAAMAAGPLLYVLNSCAAFALKELGVHEFSLSMEDDKKNMEVVLRSGVGLPVSATVYSPIALFTSRIPMPSLGSRPILESDSGDEMYFDFSTGLTVVSAGRPFSLLGRLQELKNMGCGSFVVDLSREGVFSSQGKEVIVALNSNQPVANTSLFNFDRGLE